jgi:hypothetical protein
LKKKRKMKKKPFCGDRIWRYPVGWQYTVSAVLLNEAG